MRSRTAVLAILLSVLASCTSMPQTVVTTPDTRPSLAVVGAPDGALLYVDGRLAGEAARFDGNPGTLLVEPGTHEVTVRGKDGTILLQERVFVESERKVLTVH